MADVRARVTLPYKTGLSTDVAVNDFSFFNSGGATYSDLIDWIANFYNVVPTLHAGTHAVAYYISSVINRAADACRVDIFDRATPGPPVATGTFTLAAAAVSTEFPTEVAAALSFRADYGAAIGDDRRRYRGRVFLGPLDATTAVLSGDGIPYLAGSPFINDVLYSADENFNVGAAGDAWEWQVWSTVDNLGREVIEASMDNSFDTIRSRGVTPTGRVVLPL